MPALSPLLGIDAAVNRRTFDGKHPDGWFPEQKFSVEQAIECYTLTVAYAAFREKGCGSLDVGMLADLVVLSRDILQPSERDAIAATDVHVMMVEGGRDLRKPRRISALRLKPFYQFINISSCILRNCGYNKAQSTVPFAVRGRTHYL